MWALFLWQLNSCMKFELNTLVDITETNARFNKSDSAWRQQQNFMTVVQTIGLRSNVIIDSVTYEEKAVKGLGFGSRFKGTHNCWTVCFTIEYGETTIDFLETDFNNVPIINNLDETIKLDKAVFKTKDSKETNIVFKCVD